ncbi:hypothetical protein [uncultured Martelella sp.]|uniref:hypothetical protein n=1 Tax=uncultured Martelella sp. TaxID=392331 RepID=UPI0029C6FBAD|nr:hypothetical protein [uncultured Martelella sp.]
MAKIDKHGPLKGMAAANVLISAQATEWLKHASEATGESIERLIENSAEEMALSYAKANGLLKGGAA